MQTDSVLPLLTKLLRHCLVLATLICVALGAGPPPRLVRIEPLRPTSVLKAQSPDSQLVPFRRVTPSAPSNSQDHVPLWGLIPTSASIEPDVHWISPPIAAGMPDHSCRLILTPPRARAPPA